ncbi:MAG: VCBS repeat-containing protein [Lachnospiraceae bacterium]|nr:VCBS repeat-containing protein [Lachnospiraceae bacterium]
MSKWILSGFDEISKGTFENGGQNLYVSKKGVLQRIWQYDLNKDGYVDLLIANSHGYNEHPYLYIYDDPAGEAVLNEVLTQGAQAAACADINGNGYDDLIIGVTHDGQHSDLPSYVYFGGFDGITENRKIDLAAPACFSCGIGDVNGDGKREILYLIADGIDEASAVHLSSFRVRVYSQEDTGFRMNGFKDYPMEAAWFSVCDVDGDGIDDLYCRMRDGSWKVYFGSPEGFSEENSIVLSGDTKDKERFDHIEGGGGNAIYNEFARSKQVTVRGERYLFLSDGDGAHFIHFTGRKPDEKCFVINEKNVISAAAGSIYDKDGSDIVLLRSISITDEKVLIYKGALGYEKPFEERNMLTPREVICCDFSGSGLMDIAVAQGRDTKKHSTESLLFVTDENGHVSEEPKRFKTHNCVDVLAGDFKNEGKKSLVFVNQQQSESYGDVPVYVYLGSKDGFSPDRRLEFQGHSAGSMISADFTDNGWADLLILQNAEDRPWLEPPADLYLNGPNGFSTERKAEIKAPLSWGGHAADLNKDGYLDLITCGKDLMIHYGGPDGFSDENVVILNPGNDLPKGSAIGALWPALADLNGNGWLDLVVPLSWQPYSLIYWGGPEGFSDERRTKIPVDDALTVRVADLNKNGYPDLIFGSRASYYRNIYQEGSVTIFWGGPQGYSGYNCCVLPSYQSNNITIADFNNDGYLDIFASSYFNKKERDINSYLYWNDHGHFSLTNRKRFFAHSSSAAWAGDFNEDGYVDLCLTHHRAYGSHVAESAIWWNGPEGFKEENRTWLPTIGPHDMVPNDMGNVMTRGPEEYYITPVGTAEDIKSVSWTSELPVKTWVNCQIKTASSEEELSKAAFIGKDGTGNTRFECGEEIPAEFIKGKYFKIKLYLGAVNSGGTPRLTEIRVD